MGYIGVIVYILGSYWDNGKENGDYYNGLMVKNLLSREGLIDFTRLGFVELGRFGCVCDGTLHTVQMSAINSSFHFIFHYPNMTPIYTLIESLYNPIIGVLTLQAVMFISARRGPPEQVSTVTVHPRPKD